MNASEGPGLKTKRSDLKPRTLNQATYLDSITSHDITFGIGPAGTGKTYLAVAMAVDALHRSAVQRIVLTRHGYRQVGFAGAGRANAKGDVVAGNVVQVRGLVVGAGLEVAALGF